MLTPRCLCPASNASAMQAVHSFLVALNSANRDDARIVARVDQHGGCRWQHVRRVGLIVMRRVQAR